MFRQVLITGGTGSLGTSLLEKYYDEWNFIIISRDEYKQAILKQKYPKAKFVIGNVSNYDDLQRTYYEKNYYCFGAAFDTIIHAAALKRIEVAEQFPTEAVRTNILGAANVVKFAQEYGISKVLAISTDKAVEPANVYGATKMIQERIFTEAGFNVVRYGNIFGSRGSVVEIWDKSDDINITHPDMTRFVLTLKDALALINHGLGYGKLDGKGCIIVKKSPSMRLMDLAAAFEKKYEIKGITQGEKLHETLVSTEEMTRSSEITKGYITINKKPHKDYAPSYNSKDNEFLSIGELKEMIEEWRISKLL
ncbi:MAG: polysaccharide biosynthesis protein [Phycisphaerae bacterium]|jgi:UDP-N-acetylglucosamine 4,6-dehydratase